MEGKKSFNECLNIRKEMDKAGFYKNAAIQKAYFTGAYAKAVINSSFYSEVSKKNSTFKNWLSNQLINFRNLDRIYAKAFEFEQKLKLKLKNDSEVRRLVHEVPTSKAKGLSSSKISFAFVAGFDDYSKFSKSESNKQIKNNNNLEED